MHILIMLLTVSVGNFFAHCTDQPFIFKNKFNKISLFFENAHAGVRQSLIRGLEELQIPYNINPQKNQEMGDIVFCLDGVSLLEKAIALKEKKIVKKIVVGPNILARTHMHNHILSHKAIDYYLTPSEWNKIACIQDEPLLEKIIRIWPAGVDQHYWCPQRLSKLEKQHQVLVYWKTESSQFCSQIIDILKRQGWNPHVIRYGDYSPEHYKNLLERVELAVFISRSESQGLALAECWAMNVPTLVWDSQEKLFYLGKCYDPINSCPYLTNQTGRRWKELHELEYLLKNFASYRQQFEPRGWVLDNMTDEVSVNLLLEIINE